MSTPVTGPLSRSGEGLLVRNPEAQGVASIFGDPVVAIGGAWPAGRSKLIHPSMD